MSEGHIHVNPDSITGEVSSDFVSFDIRPVLLVIVTVCVVITTAIAVKTYMDKKKVPAALLLGKLPGEAFVPADTSTPNGVASATKEATA